MQDTFNVGETANQSYIWNRIVSSNRAVRPFKNPLSNTLTPLGMPAPVIRLLLSSKINPTKPTEGLFHPVFHTRKR